MVSPKTVSPQYYEMHITLRPKHKEIAEKLAKVYFCKTSQITGDQVLGDDDFLYITGKDAHLFNMTMKMEAITYDLHLKSVPIVRRKIEHIILDERFDEKAEGN